MRQKHKKTKKAFRLMTGKMICDFEVVVAVAVVVVVIFSQEHVLSVVAKGKVTLYDVNVVPFPVSGLCNVAFVVDKVPFIGIAILEDLGMLEIGHKVFVDT